MKKNLLTIVLVGVAIINMIQAYSTELLQDEAYYWMYSKFLDWGYFDHPPMVALYIFISDIFFSGELGVRFMSSIFYSTIVYLLWKLIDIPNKKDHLKLFLMIVLSTFLFNVYGFITVPDTPLLFFMVLFLISYKRIITSNDWQAYALFSVSIAGLLYSKYTGLLIVVFTLLSNLRLLTKKEFWLSILGAIILFSPHLLWQINNDYPSIRYHLFERSSSRTYRIDYTTKHLLNQIAILGFTFPIMYFAFFKNLKNKDLFQKSLNYIVIGFISFFFVMSFKGPTQAQWTIPITFPLILITFLYLTKNHKSRKIFNKLAIVNLVIICLARIIMANDGIIPIQLEMHGNKQWVQDIYKETKGQPKLFVNSYQNASLYSFYTNDLTGAYNSFTSRKNQYNLWNFQNTLANKNILLIDGHKTDNTNYIFQKKEKGMLYGVALNNFNPIRDLNYTIAEKKAAQKGANSIEIEIYNPYHHNFNTDNLETLVALKNKTNQTLHTCKATYNTEDNNIEKNKSIETILNFEISEQINLKKIDHFDIVIRNNSKMAFQKVNN